MAARIEDDFMTAEYDGGVIATARYSADAAADGQGAWIVSGLPRRPPTSWPPTSPVPPGNGNHQGSARRAQTDHA
jgi:hypothetical protein